MKLEACLLIRSRPGRTDRVVESLNRSKLFHGHVFAVRGAVDVVAHAELPDYRSLTRLLDEVARVPDVDSVESLPELLEAE